MLRVNYNEMLGQINYENGSINHLCTANCLWAEMHFEGDQATLYGFACDLAHLKNMLKAGDIFTGIEAIIFYANTDIFKENKDLWKAARMFIDAGIEVDFRQK